MVYESLIKRRTRRLKSSGLTMMPMKSRIRAKWANVIRPSFFATWSIKNLFLTTQKKEGVFKSTVFFSCITLYLFTRFNELDDSFFIQKLVFVVWSHLKLSLICQCGLPTIHVDVNCSKVFCFILKCYCTHKNIYFNALIKIYILMHL